VIELSMFSSPAQIALARITGLGSGMPASAPGTTTMILRLRRIEDPQRDLEELQTKDWDDPRAKEARKRIKAGADSGVGLDSDGHYTLDGRRCCYGLMHRLSNREKVACEDGVERDLQCNRRWRCSCRALWEAQYEVLS